MVSIETEFKNFLVESFNLNADRMERHSGENPVHLRIRNKSGITDVQDFISKIQSLGLIYNKLQNKVYSRGNSYINNQFEVEWKNQKIGVVVAIRKPGQPIRKELTPSELELDLEYKDPNKLYDDISNALDSHPKLKKCLVSMLDNIKNGTPIQNLDQLQQSDISIITSDFGENLVAYKSVLAGNTWTFTKAKNSKVIDGYENGVPVSVKSNKCNGKVNLSPFKDLIDQSTLAGQLLFAIASQKEGREDVCRIAVQLDPEIKKLIPDTSNKGLKELMSKISYDDFYSQVSANQHFKGLGIPEPNDNIRAKKLWKEQDLHPVHMTILTWICGIWGESKEGVEQISPVVTQFLNKPKFVKVEIRNGNILTTERKFATIEKWKLKYWSRATAAWHNYPAVEPAKGI